MRRCTTCGKETPTIEMSMENRCRACQEKLDKQMKIHNSSYKLPKYRVLKCPRCGMEYSMFPSVAEKEHFCNGPSCFQHKVRLLRK